MDLIWRFDQLESQEAQDIKKVPSWSETMIRVTFFHEAKPLHYCVKHLDKPCKLNKSTTMHLLNISESYLALNIVNVRWWSGYNLFIYLFFVYQRFICQFFSTTILVCLPPVYSVIFPVGTSNFQGSTCADEHIQNIFALSPEADCNWFNCLFSDVKCGFNGSHQGWQQSAGLDPHLSMTCSSHAAW